MTETGPLQLAITRRRLLGAAGVGAIALSNVALSKPGWTETMTELPLPGGPGRAADHDRLSAKRRDDPAAHATAAAGDARSRSSTRACSRPNDQFFVRWHWAVIPTEIDVAGFRLTVHGHVNKPLSLSLAEILDGLPQRRAGGGQPVLGQFARLLPAARRRRRVGQRRDGQCALDRRAAARTCSTAPASKPGAVQVRFNGLDEPVVPDAPDFMKSLAVDHARDGEVMIAYAMNGEQLPLLNGFPLRLVVPGWYATYWVKMLNDIEVLDQPDDNYWMKTAYTIPDTPRADMKPGQTGVKMVPDQPHGAALLHHQRQAGRERAMPARRPACAASPSAAMPASSGSISRATAARPGRPARARQGRGQIQLPALGRRTSRCRAKGPYTLMVRCTNSDGVAQPDRPNWNPAGFMRNVIEATPIVAG